MSDEKDRRVHLTETPDTSHIKNIDVTHEKSDVRISAIAKFVFALIVLMVVSFVLMWAMFRILQKQNVDPARSPMALKDEERLPPEPRLQSAPGFASDLKETDAVSALVQFRTFAARETCPTNRCAWQS